MFKKIRAFVRFWKYNTIPDHLEVCARKSVIFGSNFALNFFKDARFRDYLKFSKIDQTEQDRIFNELTVTNLIFLMLLLDQVIQEIEGDEEKKDFYKNLRQTVPEYFRGFIKRIGVPEQYAEIWNKLVVLRYDEYVKEVFETRKEFLRHEEIAKLAMEKNIMIFQAIAFGLYSHLKRGDIQKDDPLYKYIQPYLMGVYKGFLKRI